MRTVTIIENYSDENGNVIENKWQKIENLKVIFDGNNNKLLITSNSVRFRQPSYLKFTGDNNTLLLGKSAFGTTSIWLSDQSSCKIGDNFTSVNELYMLIYENTCITIGNDCMFAAYNELRTSDAHPIFNVTTGERLNKSKSIIIGDHVWLGQHAIVLGGADIGSGSCIGIRSLVKGAIPNNCIAAGVPARVIKTDTVWERTHLSTPHKAIVCLEDYWGKTIM